MSRFLDGTLRGKPLRACRAVTRRDVLDVWKVIGGVGVPLALGAEAALWYGVRSFPALLAYYRVSADTLTAGALAGFGLLLAAALAVTGRALRRRFPQGRAAPRGKCVGRR